MKTVWERILAYNKGRIPEMLSKKLKTMQSNVFSFYRGSCHLYAKDYKAGFTFKDRSRVWICGDLHFENFGTFRDKGLQVYFDINDFDESALAPFSFDITRLITSFYVAAMQFKITEKKITMLANNAYDSYISILQKGRPLNGYRAIRSAMIKQLIDTVKKRKDRDLLSKWVRSSKVPGLLITAGKTSPIPEIQKSLVIKKFNKWAKKQELPFVCMDAVLRQAGTGSLGLQRYVALVENTKTKEYALMDIKETLTSCVKSRPMVKQPGWKNEAFRVIQVQKKMQFNSPQMLSTIQIGDTWYVIRSLQPEQDKIDISQPVNKLKMLQEAVVDVGKITASGHLRSCGYKGADTPKQLQKKISKNAGLKNAVLQYAAAYSKKVYADYKEFCADYKKNNDPGIIKRKNTKGKK